MIVEALEKLTRPACTLVLVGTMCLLAWRSNVAITADQFVPIVTLALGFWFGQRSQAPVVTDRRQPPNTN